MANSEAMTSSTRSFAYSYRLVKKCFVKICETSKCHNFLIFQPIFIRFSLFCSKFFTLSSEIRLNLFRSSPLSPLGSAKIVCLHKIFRRMPTNSSYAVCNTPFIYTSSGGPPEVIPDKSPGETRGDRAIKNTR